MFFKEVYHTWKSIISVLWYRGFKRVSPYGPRFLRSRCRHAGRLILPRENESQYFSGYRQKRVYWKILYCWLCWISQNALTITCVSTIWVTLLITKGIFRTYKGNNPHLFRWLLYIVETGGQTQCVKYFVVYFFNSGDLLATWIYIRRTFKG